MTIPSTPQIKSIEKLKEEKEKVDLNQHLTSLEERAFTVLPLLFFESSNYFAAWMPVTQHLYAN